MFPMTYSVLMKRLVGYYVYLLIILSKIPLGVKPKGLPFGYTPALAFFEFAVNI